MSVRFSHVWFLYHEPPSCPQMTTIESSWCGGAVTTSMLATLSVLWPVLVCPLPLTPCLPLLCRLTQTQLTQSTSPHRVPFSLPSQTSGRWEGGEEGRSELCCQQPPPPQMVWEQSVVVVVMLTSLTDMGLVSAATHLSCQP